MHTAKIDKVHVEDGDHVKQGELLVELNPRELNYTIEERRAQA
ncbi:biotin/lipoyl-binding protein [Natranaerobius thermophilus]